MTKNFPIRYEGEVQLSVDPVINCAWLPDREVKLSEYTAMVTHYVQKYIEENSDAITVCTEKFANR